jgi:hypothetical protein
MKIILRGVVGSQAYGLATPQSDVDMKGVYVANFMKVIGLDAAKAIDNSYSFHDPDREFHEIAKYMKLALKCNPTILEMLFLQDYPVLTLEGEELVASRTSFLSEPAIRGSYGAYAKAQADRLVRRNEEGKEGFSSDTKARTEKHGRHCMRLLIQGAQLLRTGEMNVDVSADREFLFDMGKLAAENPSAFHTHYQRAADKFDAIQSSLPSKPDRELADKLLQKIRIMSFIEWGIKDFDVNSISSWLDDGIENAASIDRIETG